MPQTAFPALTLVLTLIIAVGLVTAFGLRRVLSGLLFGVQSHDPATLVLVAAVLAAIAFMACLLPARRAARIDPVVALR